jgi:hypothetical protein
LLKILSKVKMNGTVVKKTEAHCFLGFTKFGCISEMNLIKMYQSLDFYEYRGLGRNAPKGLLPRRAAEEPVPPFGTARRGWK